MNSTSYTPTSPPFRVEWQPILATIGRYRCLSTRQLAELAPVGGARFTIDATLRALRAARFVASYPIPGTSRRVHHLTRRALRLVPDIRGRFSAAAATLTPDAAVWGWQRAEACRRLRAEGWIIGQDLVALAALRAYLLPRAATPRLHDALVQALNPAVDASGKPLWDPYRCSCGFVAPAPVAHDRQDSSHACTGTMRLADPLPYDVVYRVDGREPPFLLLVDNPYRALLPQLNELPVRVSIYDSARRAPVYQSPLEVMYLPPDDGSVWSDYTSTWAQLGPRLRQFYGYTTRPPAARRKAQHFPFLRTVTVRPPPNGLYCNQLRQQPKGDTMRKRSSVTARLASFLLPLLLAGPALAQVGDLSRFNSTAQTVISWIQGLGLLGCVVGFIRVGSMYYEGDDRAPRSLRNTGIGTAIIAGAAILMQFIKTSILGA